MTIEAVLVTYGWIIWTRDVAISIAEQAKEHGDILSYRIEGDEKTGKVIAIMTEQENNDHR